MGQSSSAQCAPCFVGLRAAAADPPAPKPLNDVVQGAAKALKIEARDDFSNAPAGAGAEAGAEAGRDPTSTDGCQKTAQEPTNGVQGATESAVPCQEKCCEKCKGKEPVPDEAYSVQQATEGAVPAALIKEDEPRTPTATLALEQNGTSEGPMATLALDQNRTSESMAPPIAIVVERPQGSPQRPAPAPLEFDVEESSGEDTFPVAPLGPDGLPSVGSINHEEGDCKRCCFFPKGRCTNGHDCTFCHFDHDKRRRLKRKKKKTTGSELPTPSSIRSISLVSGLLPTSAWTPGGSLGTTPTMVHAPMTPLTPTMPALRADSNTATAYGLADLGYQRTDRRLSEQHQPMDYSTGTGADGCEVPLWLPAANTAAKETANGTALSTDPIPIQQPSQQPLAASVQQQQQQQQQVLQQQLQQTQQVVDWSSYADAYKGYYNAADATTSWSSQTLNPNAPTWPYTSDSSQQKVEESGYATFYPVNSNNTADKENQKPPQPPSKTILTTSPDQLTATNSQVNSVKSVGAKESDRTSSKGSPRSQILTLVGAWGALKAPKSEGESPGKRTFLLEEALSLSTPTADSRPVPKSVPTLARPSPLLESRRALLAHRRATRGAQAPPGLQGLRLGAKAR